ncbi:MAG: BatA domain-containing protein, partial [Deltaproteobacteria bacterium]|nr:BatA domain-containing protein [Deltaproteobacteria bacterium]
MDWLSGWEFTGWTVRQVALAGGISGALVVLWFFFRPRPPRFEVASHVLWDEVAPKNRNPLVKELLMLLLQLLMVVAVAVALGDPRFVPE